jgi:hypothetical protein
MAEGGDESPENIQPLCQTCSDQKTAGEALKGRGHERKPRVPVGTDGYPIGDGRAPEKPSK